MQLLLETDCENKITAARSGNSWQGRNPDRPSPPSLQNEYFGASEAHAANPTPCRVQVRSGMSGKNRKCGFDLGCTTEVTDEKQNKESSQPITACSFDMEKKR